MALRSRKPPKALAERPTRELQKLVRAAEQAARRPRVQIVRDPNRAAILTMMRAGERVAGVGGDPGAGCRAPSLSSRG
jgi:hypothetical protein